MECGERRGSRLGAVGLANEEREGRKAGRQERATERRTEGGGGGQGGQGGGATMRERRWKAGRKGDAWSHRLSHHQRQRM